MTDTRIASITVDGRSFRIGIVGPDLEVPDAVGALRSLASECRTEDDFLEKAPLVLSQYGCEVTDILDLSPASHRPPVAQMLRFAATQRTAEGSWALIRAVLADADEAALSRLVHDGQLTFAQGLIRDVSRDLDEYRTIELAALRRELPAPYDYLLLGPEGDDGLA